MRPEVVLLSLSYHAHWCAAGAHLKTKWRVVCTHCPMEMFGALEVTWTIIVCKARPRFPGCVCSSELLFRERTEFKPL